MDIFLKVLAVVGNTALVIPTDHWIAFSEQTHRNLAIALRHWWTVRSGIDPTFLGSIALHAGHISDFFAKKRGKLRR
jgi:hypothetical protein